MRSATFYIANENSEFVYIVDTDIGGPSITNDAESVILRLRDLTALGNRRVFYRDSSGDIDELKHAGGRFTGFSFGTDGIDVHAKGRS